MVIRGEAVNKVSVKLPRASGLGPGEAVEDQILDCLSHPIFVVGFGGEIEYANPAAEQFFAMSQVMLKRQRLSTLISFGSPLLALVAQVQAIGGSVSEYAVEVATPRAGERHVDIQVADMTERTGTVLVMLQERTMAQKMDRQLTHRGAARSVTGMASILAHEIKNPLFGIRGAAQLIEQNANADDRMLTRLICEETDRICKLVDRMEAFRDNRPVERAPVNIHQVLEHVRGVAETGFARHIRFIEDYDPSLPPIPGDRDQLIQVFLNLISNAADAVPPDDGEIVLTTAYRPGVRLSVKGARDRVKLPLEVCVRDNGAGIAEDLMPYLFDPFVTTKAKGTGLGLALVAKIVGDHGGIVECESQPRRTVFRVLLPMDQAHPSQQKDLKETEKGR
jgi:two-component system nitrogen regulation sensor histidine kinase GlnL